MKTKAKSIWIGLLAAILAITVCVSVVIYIRNGDRQRSSATPTFQTSTSIDEYEKIREAIAEDFLNNKNYNPAEEEYERITLPPEGEKFSFNFDD